MTNLPNLQVDTIEELNSKLTTVTFGYAHFGYMEVTPTVTLVQYSDVGYNCYMLLDMPTSEFVSLYKKLENLYEENEDYNEYIWEQLEEITIALIDSEGEDNENLKAFENLGILAILIEHL